ncbi:hypothetical protein [Komagataeibacter medellinensis]|uniref:hypothetical protein n=1 Tax=Komagataeibacter medellinensis TaxID=1177712 RepID=UPI0011D2A8A0|nr:hypothetical protein [Komagataeibacter medellinensis]
MPRFRPAARSHTTLPLPGRLGLLGLCAALALPLAGCTGRIGEDACISCAKEKKQASAKATTSPSTPPTVNAMGHGVGGSTGSPQQVVQNQRPGVANASGM